MSGVLDTSGSSVRYSQSASRQAWVSRAFRYLLLRHACREQLGAAWRNSSYSVSISIMSASDALPYGLGVFELEYGRPARRIAAAQIPDGLRQEFDRVEEGGASLFRMRHRPCPFCFSESSSIFGPRGGMWVRCRSCRSVFRDITVDKFEQLHGEAFQDTRYVDSLVAAHGLEVASRRWDQLSLPGTSLLEIGPGTGHLLAAAHKAGRSVTAVESSEVHRKFIHDTWGIHSLYADIAAVPHGPSFNAVVAINVLEHIYDITNFLRSITKVLAPNGVLFVSTVNAVSMEATLLRNWWSMCKEHDHVPFPRPTAWREPPKRSICGRSGYGRRNCRLNSQYRQLSPRAIGPGCGVALRARK